ncbi:hypothetical protein D9M71_65880 [compost metagenome]
MSRAAFHQEHADKAREEAQRLLARREDMGGRWLQWVAGELYRLGPPEYTAMVRRELERLAGES